MERSDAPDAAAVFQQHRDRLWAIAYGILGTTDDADDIVQEAYVRWHLADRDTVRSSEAWLATTVSRLCIDRLRTRQAERKAYVGPWLPTPLVSVTPPPDRAAEVASQLSLAFLLLLERLAPEERTAFLLREVFDVSYPELSRVLGRSEPACRQVVHRARERIRRGRSRFRASAAEREALVERFAAAVHADDYRELFAILDPEASLVTDGGGKVWAARRVVRGADRVARAILGAARKRGRAVVERRAWVNGQPGIVTYLDAAPVAATVLVVEYDRILAVYRVLNPDKLRGVPGLEPERSCATPASAAP